MEVAGSSTTGLNMTPKVAFTATKMGKLPPGGVRRGDPGRRRSHRGYILKAE